MMADDRPFVRLPDRGTPLVACPIANRRLSCPASDRPLKRAAPLAMTSSPPCPAPNTATGETPPAAPASNTTKRAGSRRCAAKPGASEPAGETHIDYEAEDDTLAACIQSPDRDRRVAEMVSRRRAVAGRLSPALLSRLLPRDARPARPG